MNKGGFQMIYIYCPKCGKKLQVKEEVKFCMNCKKPYFNHPFSCVEVLVINEWKEVLLLKQNYISKTHWTIVSGYVNNGETLEECVKREVLEETGQIVNSMEYIQSYYFKPKELIMAGFIAYVEKQPFNKTNEVDDIMWCCIKDVNRYIARQNNLSGVHFDASMHYLNQK